MTTTPILEATQTLTQRLAHGVAPALATPMTADGTQLNVAVVPDLVAFLLARGVSGFFVGGTTGEGVLLSNKQRKSLHEAVVEAVDGRVPVLLHVGANTTAEALNLAQHGRDIGADALVAMTPYFITVDDDALFDYFQTLATVAPHRPFLVYDIPQLATNGISPSLLQRLAARVPNFAGIKCSRPDMQMIRQQLDVLPEGLLYLAGNERIALGSLALGATGLISGLSTAVPEPLVNIVTAFAAGNLSEARLAQHRLNQMLDHIPAGARIGAIKLILQERGIAVGAAVPPRPMPTKPIWPTLQALL
ncbi:MAG: dihydrodipicolinate synthase family protein [Anaerolineales bacterium]|nr:dihydrodipicolinate synthase family protein [Anaerolineales bacterium]